MVHCSGWPKTIMAMLLVIDVLLGPADDNWTCAAVTVTANKAKLYCDNFGKKNTVCHYRNKGCQKVSKAPKIGRKAIKQIVHEHNRARQLVAKGRGRHQPPASDMMQLTWNRQLQMGAQIWANQCKFAHDKNRLTLDFPVHVGQNVAVQMTTARYPMDFKWAIRAMWFESEMKLYRPDRKRNTLRFSAKTGHYTQIVWALTTSVGCGFAQYEKGGLYYNLYVCNYGPGGNVGNTPVYRVGRSASKCEIDSSPSKKYPGLCAEK